MSPKHTKTAGTSEKHAQGSTVPASADALTTMLATAERKANHFRSFRAQIRSTHQHGRANAAAAGQGSTQRPPRAGSSSRTLPRVRTDATWARFFGENSDAEELEVSPITLITAKPRHTASLSASAKGKQPVRTDDSILASAAAAQNVTPSTLSPEEKAQHFGPNYLSQEDSLRNDFSQRYVDSGAGELPGNAVRNPFLASRFEEYPKLKRLVQIKEELVSAKAHPPTYLYADLKASLIPSSQYHQQRRNQLKAEATSAPSTSPAGIAATPRTETDISQPGDASGDPAAGPSEPSSSKGSRTSSSATSLSHVTSLTSIPASTARGTPPSSAQPHTAQIPAPQPFHLSGLMPIKYDVVIIDPPLEVYDWEGIPTRKSGASGLDGPQNPFAPSSAAPPDPKQTWTWDQIANLPIPQLTAKESFVFLWVGSGAGDGLERGRELLAKWGYRRCEDIVWVRTNRAASKTQQGGVDSGHGNSEDHLRQTSTSSVLQRSVQHCLMGIRGTVRRSSDTRFVHCNVDIDVVIWEGEDDRTTHVLEEDKSGGSYPKAQDHVRAKPEEMYSLIENFCSGTRRLELFGTNRNLRRGWLTVGLEVGPHAPGFPEALSASYSAPQKQESSDASTETPKEEAEVAVPPPKMVEPVAYHKQTYDSHFGVDRPGCDLRERKNLLPYSSDIEALRPKSPAPRNAHSRVDSENPLTPPPSGTLALHSHHNSGSPSSGPGWGSPAAVAHGPSQQGQTGTAVPASILSSPRASPRNSIGARTLQHKMSMSPTTFGAMNLPALPMQQQLGFGQGSPGPASPTRARHGLPLHHHHHHMHHPGGAGLSGLGAGGPKVVSVPSGSETLSGPQASVLFGTKHAKGTGPVGLGRRGRG
ncbi:hypothetical protein CF326_g1605 [Tilletia indica]|nr:hypothetical protein CF326_g1605 [Tilletia indica]